MVVGLSIEVSVYKSYGLKLGINKVTDLGSLVTTVDDGILIKLRMETEYIYSNGQTMIFWWTYDFLNRDNVVGMNIISTKGTRNIM